MFKTFLLILFIIGFICMFLLPGFINIILKGL